MTQPLRPGDPERVGVYLVRGRIGEGGQGVVYLGTGPDGTRVAVKLLRPLPVGDTQARMDAAGRFVKEVAAAKRVARFCTAQVLEVGRLGERPFIISEFVAGPSLKQLVAADGPRTGATLERLAISTATALVAIHRVGVVHRDFNPNNVLMGPDGPRVIDFGLARAMEATTTSGPALGTPAYMAPEQLAGQRVTPAADVFAWADTIVFAATGRTPFDGTTMAALMNHILRGSPRLDGVPVALRSLLAACLAKDAARRPNAQQILDRLLSLAEEDSSATRRDTPVLSRRPVEETVAEPGSWRSPPPVVREPSPRPGHPGPPSTRPQAVRPPPGPQRPDPPGYQPDSVGHQRPDPVGHQRPDPAGLQRPDPAGHQRPDPATRPVPQQVYRPRDQAPPAFVRGGYDPPEAQQRESGPHRRGDDGERRMGRTQWAYVAIAGVLTFAVTVLVLFVLKP